MTSTSKKGHITTKESIENLVQILSQLEQNLRDADDDRARKEISRHIRNTKLVMDAIKKLH